MLENVKNKNLEKTESENTNSLNENTTPNLEGGVRTYASDIAEMMKKEKGSIIKIALAEQQRREEFKKANNPVATKNIIVIFLGIALIVSGIMIFVYSVMSRAKSPDVINLSQNLPALLFSENQSHIDMTELNRRELLNAINTQVNNKTLGAGTINNLFISYRFGQTQSQVPVTMFMHKLGINIPDSFFQNLEDSFMLGVFNQEQTNELFLILKVKDFNEAFLSMREWEASMLSEFVNFFNIDTSSYGRVIFSKDFETVTLFNKESRILKDSSGLILLSYTFLDPKTILVTTKGDSLDEILKRINLQTLK